MIAESEQLLKQLRSQGLSSPAGINWDRFCKVLKRSAKLADDEGLPNPLILDGDVASHAHKHERLGEQLAWAERHGCVVEAVVYLNTLPKDKWNRSNGEESCEESSDE